MEVDKVWRIEVMPDGSINTMYFGIVRVDSPTTEVYETYDNLPEWMKDRLAVLIMLKPSPQESIVYGVGRRITESVFWAVEPRNLNGADT
jgi:hypothetical protein